MGGAGDVRRKRWRTGVVAILTMASRMAVQSASLARAVPAPAAIIGTAIARQAARLIPIWSLDIGISRAAGGSLSD